MTQYYVVDKMDADDKKIILRITTKRLVYRFSSGVLSSVNRTNLIILVFFK